MTISRTKTALVTGSTGFVGSHLARRLVRDDWQVHVIVRPSSALHRLKEAKSKVIVHRHDGTTEGMLAIMQEAQPEIVFHLASLFISDHQLNDVAPLIQSNLLFGTQLLDSMKQTGVMHLVNTGTSWQHYQNEDYHPVNLYAATKQAFEDILRYYLETAEMKVITLSLFDTYGSDDPRPKLLNLLKEVSETGRHLDMSLGEQTIDLVFIDDVVAAFTLAGERLLTAQNITHEKYVVSSGHPIKLRDLVFIFSELSGKPLSIGWGARPYRQREVMKPWSSGTPLQGWSPSVDLRAGIDLFLRQF